MQRSRRLEEKDEGSGLRAIRPARISEGNPVTDIAWKRTHLLVINGDKMPRHKNNAKIAAEAGLANDAVGVYVAGLIEEEIGGVERSKSTVGKLEKSLEEIGKNTKKGDTVFLYITGHGGDDKFIVESGILEYGKLLEMMEKHLAGREIILVSDACHSGDFIGKLVDSKAFVKVSAMSPGVNEEKTSCKYFAKPFWHAVKRGLDLDGNNVATIEEAFWYALNRYRKYVPDTPGTYRESIPEIKSLGEVNDGLVMATAEWCGTCKNMRPVFNGANVILKGALPFYEIYLERGNFGKVRKPNSVPTFFIVKKGRIVAKKTGAMTVTELSAWMEKNGFKQTKTKDLFKKLYKNKDYTSIVLAFSGKEIIGELGERRARKMLEKALSNELPEVRRECIGILKELGDAWAVGKTMEMASDKDWRVREKCIGALEDLIPDKRRSKKDSKEYEKAQKKAATLDFDKIVSIFETAISDGEGKVREEAGRALVNATNKGVDTEDAVPMLVERLSDRNEGVRKMAAIALGSIAMRIYNTEHYIVELVKRNFYPSAKVRSAARRKASLEIAVPLLVERLLFENSVEVKGAAARTLGEVAKCGVDIGEAIPILVETLYDENKRVRSSAAGALSNAVENGAGIKEAVPRLREMLFDDYKGSREYAAKALKNAKEAGLDISGIVSALEKEAAISVRPKRERQGRSPEIIMKEGKEMRGLKERQERAREALEILGEE